MELATSDSSAGQAKSTSFFQSPAPAQTQHPALHPTPAMSTHTVEGRQETTALDLSRDIWLLVVDYFKRESPKEDDKIGVLHWSDYEDNPRTEMLHLRSTCRTLQSYVDPVLFPIICVYLNARSLRRLEGLSRNPSIASGVRGLNLSLPMLPAWYAHSMNNFFERFEAIVDAIAQEVVGTMAADDATYDDLQSLRVSLEKCDRTCVALSHWAQCYTAAAQEYDKVWPGLSTEDGNYAALLFKSFRTYQDLQRQQEQMLKDRSFVKRLAGTVSRFRNLGHVKVDDCATEEYDVIRDIQDDTVSSAIDFMDDLDYVRTRLLRSIPWDAVQLEQRTQPNRTPERLPVRLLTELPIACHKAGAPLRGYTVECFPRTQNFGRLFNTEVDRHVLGDFSAACRNLRAFKFSPDNLYSRPLELLGDEDLKAVQKFIGVSCSGPQLESVWLDPEYLEHGEEIESSELIKIGSIAEEWTSTSISRMLLTAVSISSDALEGMISHLVLSPKRVELSKIYLTKGKWAKAINMLRDKLDPMPGKEEDKFYMDDLKGGEFGDSCNRELLDEVYAFLEGREDQPNPLEHHGIGE